MKKYDVLKDRMDTIIRKNNIESYNLTTNYENKFRELLLNYSDNMLQKNLDLMHEKNIENFIDYMFIIQKLYKDTIASILIIEKRIFNSYRYVTNSNNHLSFWEINKEIYNLEKSNYEQYKSIKKLLWKKNIDSDLFYIALELCRKVRNQIIHKDWIGLIKVKVKLEKYILLSQEIKEKIDSYNIYIDQEKEVNLIDCFILIDYLMEASNLFNNFNNIKDKLNKYIML